MSLKLIKLSLVFGFLFAAPSFAKPTRPTAQCLFLLHKIQVRDGMIKAMARADSRARHSDPFNQLQVLSNFLSEPLSEEELVKPATKFQIKFLSDSLQIHPLAAQNRFIKSRKQLIKNALIVLDIFSSQENVNRNLDHFFIYGELYQMAQSLKVGLALEALLSSHKTQEWLWKSDRRIPLKDKLISQIQFDTTFSHFLKDVIVAVLREAD